MEVQINVVNTSRHSLPKYETLMSAGMDVRANLDASLTMKPLERVWVPTGLFISLPEGYEMQIRPRSGLAAKHGITVLNAPGTIDADFRGEIGVILINLSDSEYVINDGERIAQMIVARYEHARWNEVEELDETQRGTGGLGHTGNR